MSFLAITAIVIAVIIASGTVVAISFYDILHPPKKIISLSPEAFDMKMRNIENNRLSALALCSDPDAIDVLNKEFDGQRDTYKIGR